MTPARLCWTLAAVISLSPAVPLHAKKAPPKPLPIKLTAEVKNRFLWDLKKDNAIEDRSQTLVDVSAQLKYLPNPVVQVVAGEWTVDGRLRPYTAYANFAFNHVNVRLGNQIVRWGKADEISPLDVVNPENLTEGFTRVRADRKIPVPMTNVELLSDVVSLQGIFIPFFQKSEFRYTGSDWALFGHADRRAPTFRVIEDDPALTLRDAGYGGRLSGALGRVDVAFLYLNHRRDTPSMAPYAFPAPTDPTRESSRDDLVAFSTTTFQMPRFRYLREELYGFEFETTIGSVGLRGDASYVSSHSFITAGLQEQRRPLANGVIGVDYNGPNNSYFNVSASYAKILDFDPTLAPLDETTTGLYGQATMEFLSGNVKMGYQGFVNMTDKSFYHNPTVQLKFIPNVEVESGLLIYGGSPSTDLGYYDNNDEAYLNLNIYF